MKLRLTPAFALCIVALLALTTAAFAGEFMDYPEFRYTSALPGGGWGVTPDGTPGFEGAMQTSIPVAYTPHRGVIVGYSCASYDSTPRFQFKGAEINGTATVGMGFGDPGHGIYVAEMGTGWTGDGVSNLWEGVQNVQVQIGAGRGSAPAFAIGVQDIFSQRDDTLTTKGGGGRSFYAVLTKECEFLNRPLFLTGGMGTARFGGPFGGVSWRAHDKVTVLGEYDGWNFNAGAAFDLSDWLVDDTILTATMVDMERFVLAITYVNRSWPDF